MPKTDRNSINKKIKIDKNGSLGLLAIGDLGLRAWRHVKGKIKNGKS